MPSTAGNFSAIVQITSHGRGLNWPNFRDEAGFSTDHDYALLLGDALGTGETGGDFVYLALEGKDGHDLIEWMTRQSWLIGRIGIRGASYSGENQWYTVRETFSNKFYFQFYDSRTLSSFHLFSLVLMKAIH